MELPSYPERKAIDRREFAVRHMLLEEIKYRSSAHWPSVAPEAELLTKIADALVVEHRREEAVYAIILLDEVLAELPAGELKLYVRGDSAQAAREQSDLRLCSEHDSDGALSSNRRIIASLVDQLLEGTLEQAKLEPKSSAD